MEIGGGWRRTAPPAAPRGGGEVGLGPLGACGGGQWGWGGGQGAPRPPGCPGEVGGAVGGRGSLTALWGQIDGESVGLGKGHGVCGVSRSRSVFGAKSGVFGTEIAAGVAACSSQGKISARQLWMCFRADSPCPAPFSRWSCL